MNLRGQNIALVRVDRIGDLVLSLPVDESLQRMGAKTSWIITKGLAFVCEMAKPKREAIEIERGFSLAGMLGLIRHLKSQKFTMAVLFHTPWWVSMSFWLAGVPVRIGVKSQWHSFLFLTNGVRQKRSAAEHSELEYSFRLVEDALNLNAGDLGRQSLFLGTLLLHEVRPKLDEGVPWPLAPQSYVVVHPGMGGSALNWPTQRYIDLIDELVTRIPVVITGTFADRPYLEGIRKSFGSHPRVVWLDGKLKGPELISVLANAGAVIAPSTGVLHLAASTGVFTLGIFSPVRVQAAKRWGPQGLRTATVSPQVQCPGELSCLKSECAKYNCMDQILVDDVVRPVYRQLGFIGRK